MWKEPNERGQVVIIVAFAFIVLLAAVGLAIDGGNLHFTRRSMQTAADAAALAGTRLLAEAICGDDTIDDAAIAREVNSYAERNGVEDTDDTLGNEVNRNVEAYYVQFENNTVMPFDPPQPVGGGTIPVGATGIAMTNTFTQTTYFMTVVGHSEAVIQAEATAVTGPPLLLGGMRPFGVPLQLIDSMDVGDCFTSSFKNCDPSAPPGDPTGCYIYNDDGDQVGQHRNWMNFNHVWNAGEEPDFPRATGSSGSSSDLQEWMSNGWNGILYADCFWADGCAFGDYIHAKPGTNSAPIGDVPIDTLFFIPIYDITPEYEYIPFPKAEPIPQGGDHYYHIVGFAGIRVAEGDVDQGGGTIRACIDELIYGEGQPSPAPGSGYDEGGACGTHFQVVALWR